MQVHLTPHQEARLSHIADQNGTNAERLVLEAALRLVQDESDFNAGVERGIVAAERGEFVEHTEVWTRIEAIPTILRTIRWTAPAAAGPIIAKHPDQGLGTINL